MTTLILGAGGPIGTAISEALSAAGASHISVSRSASGPGAYAADRTDTSAILRVIAERNVSHIIDVIAYTEAETLPLLAAIDGKVERYVMLSSADVYRNYGLLNKTETGSPSTHLTEDAPLRTRLYPYKQSQPRADTDPQKWMDEYDKIPLENAVRVMQSDWTILRLPMVYGAAGKLNRFEWITKPIRSGEAAIRAGTAWLEWVTTYSHVANVADAIAHTAKHPAASNQTFNITDHAPMSHREWIAAFAECANWTGEIRIDENQASATTSLDLSVPLRIDGSKHLRLTDFVPQRTREKDIQEVLEQQS